MRNAPHLTLFITRDFPDIRPSDEDWRDTEAKGYNVLFELKLENDVQVMNKSI
jgi:hypothetical protein